MYIESTITMKISGINQDIQEGRKMIVIDDDGISLLNKPTGTISLCSMFFVRVYNGSSVRITTLLGIANPVVL